MFVLRHEISKTLPRHSRSQRLSQGIIVLINAGIAAWTEHKAGDALEASRGRTSEHCEQVQI